ARREYKKLIEYIPLKVNDKEVLYKPELNFLLGQAYFQLSDYEKALPLLDEYLSRLAKANKYELFQLGYAQYKTGDYRRAIENFIQLNLLQDTIGQYASFTLAECYLKTNQKEKALAAFQGAASLQFDKEIQKISRFNYGKLLVETGNYSEAVNILSTFISQYPASEYRQEASELLAQALFETRNYEAAYQLIEKLDYTNPRLSETYQKLTYYRAIQLLNDGKPDEAEKLCNKSLQVNIDKNITARALFLKAEAHYRQMNFAGAAFNYAKSLEAGAVYDSTFSPFLAYYNMGYAYFKLKEYKKAASSFENAIMNSSINATQSQKNSMLPDAYLRFAECAFVTQRYDDALEAFTKIESSNWPQAEYALFQKAIILGLKNKNSEKIRTLEAFLSRYPTSRLRDQAYFEIGETHLEEANYDDARNAFDQILNRFPGSMLTPKSHLKIALILYNKNKKAEAFEWYQKVLQNYPASNEAKEALIAMREVAVEIGKTEEYLRWAGTYGNLTPGEQDSLSWQAAEKALGNNDCDRAVPLLNQYISRFSRGSFTADAWFARAECLVKAKKFDPAYEDYMNVIENKSSKYYERALLRAAAIAYYEKKDYNAAITLYEKLLSTASSAANVYNAQLGLLKCADKINDDERILEYADKALANSSIKESDLIEISYLKGRALYRKNDFEKALPLLNKVANAAVSEKGAECKYYVCRIAHEKQQYQSSLEGCIQLKNKFAAYEYWVVKGFILMADNYVALNNTFQAKATLESIVNYYEGDVALKEEAKQKLDKLRKEELMKSKINSGVSEDTLQMESPLEIK
ncbi:MAG: tetratricopeptide repeat protein, partial [Chitinophagales bacterium]|nr:tetratricopeptide repeat protein [Chitinophagales bacterium]